MLVETNASSNRSKVNQRWSVFILVFFAVSVASGALVWLGAASSMPALRQPQADSEFSKWIAGMLDRSFSSDGMGITPVGGGADYANDLAIQADRKIVVVGYSHVGGNKDIAVVRYNPDGSLDTTFSGDGKVTTPIVHSSNDVAEAVSIQPDGIQLGCRRGRPAYS